MYNVKHNKTNEIVTSFADIEAARSFISDTSHYIQPDLAEINDINAEIVELETVATKLDEHNSLDRRFVFTIWYMFSEDDFDIYTVTRTDKNNVTKVLKRFNNAYAEDVYDYYVDLCGIQFSCN